MLRPGHKSRDIGLNKRKPKISCKNSGKLFAKFLSIVNRDMVLDRIRLDKNIGISLIDNNIVAITHFAKSFVDWLDAKSSNTANYLFPVFRIGIKSTVDKFMPYCLFEIFGTRRNSYDI